MGGGRVAYVSGHAVVRGGLQVFSEGSASRLERGVARGARRGFERESAAAGEVLEARTLAGGIGRAEGGGDVRAPAVEAAVMQMMDSGKVMFAEGVIYIV